MTTNFAEDDKNEFKNAAKKARIEITGDAGDDTRIDAIKAAVEKVFADNLKICDKPGRDWNGKCMEGDLNEDWFHFDTCRKLRLALPTDNDDDPGNLVGHGGGISIQFKIDLAKSINGTAARDYQVLTIPAQDNDSDDIAGAKASTVCHELGHRMGMTIMKSKVSPGMPAAKHVDNSGDYYIDDKKPYTNGKRSVHRGPHCAHGVSARNKRKHDLGGGSGADCIMYGSGGRKDNRKSFCDTCKDYIKARNLTSITCNWATRGQNLS